MQIKTFFFAIGMLIAVSTLAGCRQQGCMSVTSCNYDDEATKDDGSCINKGSVTFWHDTTAAAYDIVVVVNASEALITNRLTATPSCDASGCANFSLCPGSHNYTAHEAFPGIRTWTGDAVSTEEGCLVIHLQ